MKLFVIALTCFLFAPSASAGNYEVEPNNLPGNAMAISVNEPIQGNVADGNDVDLFSFNSGTATSIRVLFYRPPDNYQYTISTLRILEG